MSLLWPVEEQAMDSARRLLVRSWDQPVAFPWWPWSLKMLPPMKSLRPICWPRIWKKWLGTLNAVIEACVKRKKTCLQQNFQVSRPIGSRLLAPVRWASWGCARLQLQGEAFQNDAFFVAWLRYCWDSYMCPPCAGNVLLWCKWSFCTCFLDNSM